MSDKRNFGFEWRDAGFAIAAFGAVAAGHSAERTFDFHQGLLNDDAAFYAAAARNDQAGMNALIEKPMEDRNIDNAGLELILGIGALAGGLLIAQPGSRRRRKDEEAL